MWRLGGYDTFEGESYELGGSWSTREEAEAAAARRLVELERDQPTRSSGGTDGGVQDQVFVIGPAGERSRYTFPVTGSAVRACAELSRRVDAEGGPSKAGALFDEYLAQAAGIAEAFGLEPCPEVEAILEELGGRETTDLACVAALAAIAQLKVGR